MAGAIPTLCGGCGVWFPSRNQKRNHLPCPGRSTVSTPEPENATTNVIPYRPAPKTKRKEFLKKHRPTFAEASSQFVTIIVGTDKRHEEFQVHKDFLGGISTYFKNLFEGDFREASALKSKCDILTPTQFKIFLEWLYSRRLVDRDGNEDEHLSDCDLPYLQQFADMYQIESLRRDTFLAFCGKQRPDTSAAPHPYDVNLTFELFPKDSQWCRFLVDIYAWDVFNDGMSQDGRLDFPDELRLLSPEFIWRVLWVKSTEGRT